MAQSLDAPGWTIAFNAVAGVLVGSFVGIAVAQRVPSTERGPSRSASLTVRDVDAYRTPHGTTHLRAATAVFVVVITVVAVTASHDLAATLVATALVAGSGLGFAAWAHRIAVQTVERERPVDDPVRSAVDDCLRSCAVRAMQHATIGVLACGIGLLALVAINTHSYEAVKIDDRTVFEVPDGGALDRVVTRGHPAIVERTTVVTIHWTDADGDGHVTRRPRPPGTYLGFGNYIDGTWVISLGGLALVASLVVGLRQWSAAAKAWRHPAPPRLEPV
jgi:hypothetical protein